MKYQHQIKNTLLAAAIFLVAGTTVIAQNTKPKVDLEHLNYTVEEAPDWTNLFIRTSGWFGADGIYVLPSDGGRSKGGSADVKNMFIFSDTMIGEINNGKIMPGDKMVHNTVAYLDGDKPDNAKMNFHWATNDKGTPVNMFSPNTPSSKAGDYYWLGDGFVNTALNKTYIFAYRMHNMDVKDDWSFRQMGVNLVILPKGSKAPFKDYQQIETPLAYPDNGGSYGAGIFLNTKKAGAPAPDGYVYVYGVRGKLNLVVSRVLPKDFENFSKWRFWDGKAWNPDMDKAATLTTDVSDELSVSPLPDGRYLLVFQIGGMSRSVGMRLGASPVGPFGPIINLYTAKVAVDKYTTYNAKAHPSISAPGELIISYNQNSFDFWDQIQANPNLYHPYFLRLKFK